MEGHDYEHPEAVMQKKKRIFSLILHNAKYKIRFFFRQFRNLIYPACLGKNRLKFFSWAQTPTTGTGKYY